MESINLDQASILARQFLMDKKYLLKCNDKQKHAMRDLRKRLIKGGGIGLSAVAKCMAVMGYKISFEKSAENLAR